MKKHMLTTVGIIALSSCSIGKDVYIASTNTVLRSTNETMLPAITPGARLFVDTMYYSTHSVQRFEIIVVKSPRMSADANGANPFVVKRVIGLAGERIEIHRGRIFINRSELKEPFAIIPDESDEEFSAFDIPPTNYFLMGDNRPNSEDSRFWKGYSVDKNSIIGKVTEIRSE